MTDAPRKPTQADVATLAGVSVATVSYVVSGRRNRTNPATPEVSAKVRAAMDQLGYQPQRAGRVLQSRRTGLVAVVAYTPLNPWITEAITQVEEVADRLQMGVVIVRYQRDDHIADRATDLVVDGIADACILMHAPEFGRQRAERIAATGIPTLVFGPDWTDAGVDAVVQHEAEAIGDGVRHLIDQRCSRIAFVSNPDSLEARDSRLTTFLTQASAAGLAQDDLTPILPRLVQGPRDGAVLTAVLAAINQPAEVRPQAVMCASDRAAIATMWAALHCGLRIPEDIRIIGAGNIEEGRQTQPALTTLGCDPPNYRDAIQHTFERIGDADRSVRTFHVPWRLIKRGSA